MEIQINPRLTPNDIFQSPLIATMPGSPEAQLALAVAHYRNGDFQEMIELGTSKRVRSPDLIQQYFPTMAYWRTGAEELAQQDFAKAMELAAVPGGDEFELQMLRKEVESIMGQHPSEAPTDPEFTSS